MKTISETKYRYIGTTEVFDVKYHMFQSIFEDFDQEILLVTRARLVKKDGDSLYYDKIQPENQNNI